MAINMLGQGFLFAEAGLNLTCKFGIFKYGDQNLISGSGSLWHWLGFRQRVGE